MITTSFQTQFVPMPICRYEILDSDGENAELVKFALIGQAVFHKWTCDTETGYHSLLITLSPFVLPSITKNSATEIKPTDCHTLDIHKCSNNIAHVVLVNTFCMFVYDCFVVDPAGADRLDLINQQVIHTVI